MPEEEWHTSPEGEWHSFDVEHGYYVKQIEYGWLVRDHEGHVTHLTDGQFDQLRSPGANPRGLL